jgi:peptide/nickel transport system permease protein
MSRSSGDIPGAVSATVNQTCWPLGSGLPLTLIAPFTVIMLQFPWLLTGVVIVEAMFNYKGFGWVLVQAAGNNDIDLLLAISWVAVIVVLLTQLISDIGYAYLNPRIRVK